MKTSCRFCEFNIREDGKQVGCEISNLIEKYNAKNIKIESTIFDDEHGKDESFIVDTFCLYRRPSGWKKAQNLNDDQTYEQLARKELEVGITLVVYIPPDTFKDKNSREEFSSKMHMINNMSKTPKDIIFVCADKNVNIFHFKDVSLGVPWRMEFLLEQHKDARIFAHDLASKKIKTTFFVTLDWDVIPDLRLDYLQVIENKIIDELDQFLCILPLSTDKKTPAVYHTNMYRSVLGNKQLPVEEKLKALSEEQECQNLIKEQSYLM